MVPYDVEHVYLVTPTITHPMHTYADLTLELRYNSPKFKELKTPFCHALWHRYRCEEFSENTAFHLIHRHLFPTRTKMSLQVKKWYLFCQLRKIDPVCPPFNSIVYFFSTLEKTCLNHIQTALNWILHYEISHKVSCSRETTKLCTSRVYHNAPRLISLMTTYGILQW